MTTTPRGSPELTAAQAVPETTVNEQILRTEAGAGRYPVASRVTAPPGSCANGATYLIIATATGAFATKENQLATAVGTNAASGWLYRVPGTIDEGVLAYVQDTDVEYKWSGSAWATYSSGASGANPSATASDTAVNGSAATFMRSDGAPAIQKTSSSVFGVAKVDGTTITASGGVISAVGVGGSITAKDEGSTLTSALTSLDFVGSGVVATNTSGAVTVTIAGGGSGYSSGTSFPGSPATDDIFYRTDRRILYFYDGTRWLSTTLYSEQVAHQDTGSTSPLVNVTGTYRSTQPYWNTYSIYVEKFKAALYATSGGGSASNYHILQLSSPSGNLGSTISGQGDTLTVFTGHEVTVNAVVPSTDAAMQVAITKTGSPTTFISCSFTYRLVG